MSDGRLPDVGDVVTFHGRAWTVTAWSLVTDDDEPECRDLTLEREDDDSTVVTWVDACAVQPAAPAQGTEGP